MTTLQPADRLATEPRADLIEARAGRLTITLAVPPDRAVEILKATIDGRGILGRSALVELQLDGSLRARVARGYRGTVAGASLRYRSHSIEELPASTRLTLVQVDPQTGVSVSTVIELLREVEAVRLHSVVTNNGDREVTLRAVSSLSISTIAPARTGRYSLVSGRSDWLGEGRWGTTELVQLLPNLDLPFYEQSSRGRFAQTSSGAWSTSELLPLGLLIDSGAGALAWQIESSAGWHWEVADDLNGVRVIALGPTDAEHQFSRRLARGEQFVSVAATLAIGSVGAAGNPVDEAAAALTRSRRHQRRISIETAPVIYNDYMNTLMGQPSTEALEPLIAAAAEAGAEIFCIDAGWFAEVDGDYWDSIGDWEPAKTRFTNGLGAVIATVRAAGMIPGLWLEPEAVGERSDAFRELPDDAFFERDGDRILEQGRAHLDFTRATVRERLDRIVADLVDQFGIGYLKLDYNIDPGVGTDRGEGVAPGLGLLEHSRAYADWLADIATRHPGLLVETCASGAMRSDAAILAVSHLQSTSDQQNARHSVPIAASAPLMIPPEQAGDWAYPAQTMSDGETALTLVSGLAGRLYLSGFLGSLRASQKSLVAEAVELHKRWRPRLGESVPRWPLGLPQWSDPEIALVLDAGERMLVLAWSRGGGRTLTLQLPREARLAGSFPRASGDTVSVDGHRITIELPAGPAAVAVELEAVPKGTE